MEDALSEDAFLKDALSNDALSLRVHRKFFENELTKLTAVFG